ncbi:hypothetical protein ANCCAN_15707, partial [Ancylostoma caninum]
MLSLQMHTRRRTSSTSGRRRTRCSRRTACASRCPASSCRTSSPSTAPARPTRVRSPATRARVPLALAADFANCALSLSVVDRLIVARRSIRSMRCAGMVCLGEYSCLRTQMVLRREFSYYLLQLYIPSFMLVIVSWVSFWLDKDSVPARVTLGM